MGRRIALTGSSGYIGTGVVARLQEDPAVEHILGLDLRSPAETPPKLHFERRDVRQPFTDLFREHGITEAVHMAYVLDPSHDAAGARAIALDGTRSFLAACAAAGVRRALYTSSTSTYGPHPDWRAPLPEDAPQRPPAGFQYAVEKVETERMFLQWAAERPETAVVIMRAPPVFGAHVDNFLSRFLAKPVVFRVPGHDPPLQFLHEQDMSAAVVALLERAPAGVYNVAADDALPYTEVASIYGRRPVPVPAAALRALAGATWALRLAWLSEVPPAIVGYIQYPWAAATDKVKREVGFSCTATARRAVEEFVRARRA